jgi:hypothetical protein
MKAVLTGSYKAIVKPELALEPKLLVRVGTGAKTNSFGSTTLK